MKTELNYSPQKFTEIEIGQKLTQNEKELIREQNKIYFLEHLNLKKINELLKTKLQKLEKEKLKCKQYIQKLEITKVDVKDGDSYNMLRRKRRKKSELEYKYICQHPNCGKKYVTETALNQHMKLKHEKN